MGNRDLLRGNVAILRWSLGNSSRRFVNRDSTSAHVICENPLGRYFAGKLDTKFSKIQTTEFIKHISCEMGSSNQMKHNLLDGGLIIDLLVQA
jgi:hypothetical protein